MGRLVTVIFMFALSDIYGQGFIPLDTLHELPKELSGVLKGTFKSGFRADFDGDGKRDYIYRIILSDNNVNEYWITSYLQTKKIVPMYEVDIYFFWLVNLDNDPEAEIVRVSGYEDGINYAIYDSDIRTGKEFLVCHFNPVIIEGNKTFWGYPWDIKDIVISRTKNKVFVRASLDHDIIRDGEVTIPQPPAKFPVIIFIGHSTQPDIKVEEIRNLTWLTIEDLR